MQLQQLHYLKLIVEKGSFAAAAEAAGVSQPAITMAMKRLEQSWGISLFHKVGRQKLPSLAAVLAAQQTGDLLHGLSNLQALGYKPFGDMSPDADTPVLRVGMSPAAALLYAPVVECQWRLSQPNGLLSIVSGTAPELLGGLIERTLDLAIAPQPRGYKSSYLKRATLYTSEPNIYARVGHSLRHATSLSDIADVGWTVTGRSGTPGNVIEEAHRVRGLAPPRVLVRCNDYPTMLSIVAQSDLLCVVPHSSLVTKALDVGLVPMKIREGLPQYEVCAFWPVVNAGRYAKTVQTIVNALERPASCSGFL